MVSVKKRKKSGRMRGRHNYGWGFKKKNRGSGHRGGVGMSGTGKRASQKVQYAQIVAKKAGFETYFGARGMTSGPTARKVNKVLNLQDIEKNFLDNASSTGGATKSGQKEVKLEGYKILGKGNGIAATIYAKSASKSAIEKIQKAGGKLILESTAVVEQREARSERDSKKNAENKKAEEKRSEQKSAKNKK